MRLIVTRPHHDITTSYLSVWAKDIVEFAEQKGADVIDLPGKTANRKELESRIKKLQPELVFLNGHGDDDRVAGHDNEILVKSDDNHDILKGRITYALACKSGQGLGRRISEDDGATYIGYSDDFVFMSDRSYVSRPLNDPKAEPFKKSSNQVMISLLKGHSAKEASERSKNVFKEQFDRLLSSSANPDSLPTAKYLWWNMRNQVCLGNGEAKLPKH